MIMNGIEQSVIDSMCSTQPSQTQPAQTQQPIQVIINNSSSANNANTNNNVNTNTLSSAQGNLAIDSIRRDRIYLALNVMGGSGTHTNSYSSNFSSNTVDVESDVNGGATSLSIGYVFDTNNRFEIASSSVTVDEWENTTIDGIDFNWIWVLGTKHVQVSNLRPYLLFGFGSYGMTGDYTTSLGIEEDTINAFAVNFGIGITYPVNNSLEVDLGLHAKTLNWQDVTYYDDSSNQITLSQTTSLSGLNISLRYKF